MNLFTPMEEALISRLVYRRQFVLAPRPLENFRDWQRKNVAGKWTVHAHSDLALTQVKSNTAELTLLGYCLNPDRPEQTDEQICVWLLAGTPSIEELVRRTHRLGGRWVMIYCRPDNDYLFTDACGLRLVNYAVNHPDGPWCFTQPEAVKDVLHLKLNAEAERDFFSTSYYLNCVEHWLPGNDTHYDGVKHLCPNHYLDLRTSKVTRFWPWKKLESRSVAEALPEVARLLRDVFAAAANRFPLALPLTAGWDSRLLLAVSRPFSKDIFYYTLQYNSHKQDQHDLVVPPRLMARLGLPHHLFECPAGMSKSFSRLYFNNVSQSYHAHGPIVYGLYRFFPQDHVCLKGLCGEIARCYLYKYGQPASLDGRALALITLGAKRYNDYAIRHFDRWLSNARIAAGDLGYEILDLFQWEQKVANSAAPMESQCDIVCETLWIYNCRALLEILLSVPAGYRSHPNYVFYRKLIRHLWPETLSEPINPVPFAEALRFRLKKCETHAKSILKRLRLPDTAKKL